MNKKKLVYILGAGSSKDFGLPLGHEYFKRADELSIEARKDTDFKTIFDTVLCKANADINKIYFNLPEDKLKYPPLEEVLTLIYDQIEPQRRLEHEMYEANHHRGKAPEREPLFHDGIISTFDNLVNLMGLTILGSMRFYCSDADMKIYHSFIKSLNFHDQQISFISLNYDTILDNVLLKCTEEEIIDGYNYGLALDNINDDKDKRIDGKIFLLKPHGSLNLFYCSHRGSRSIAPGFYFSESTGVYVDLVTRNRRTMCPWRHCSNIPTPLIIPPLYNKKIFIKDVTSKTQPKAGFWPRDNPEMYRYSIDKELLSVLESADEIVVIGYSMPAYDTDFKGMLINGLISNNNRRGLCLKIITRKENDNHIQNVKSQYERLVKNVIIESEHGFLNYIKSSGL